MGEFYCVCQLGRRSLLMQAKARIWPLLFPRNRYKLWYNTSPYHNVPLVNGVEQEPVGTAKATHVVFNSDNNITNFTMNLEKAYPEKAGIRLWQRNITVDHRKNTIEVKDNYQLNNPQLTQTFMTVCDADITTAGKIIFTTEKNEKVQLCYDGRRFGKRAKKPMPLTEPHEQGLKTTLEP